MERLKKRESRATGNTVPWFRHQLNHPSLELHLVEGRDYLIAGLFFLEFLKNPRVRQTILNGHECGDRKFEQLAQGRC